MGLGRSGPPGKRSAVLPDTLTVAICHPVGVSMIPKLIAVLVIAALVWLCVRSWYPIRVTIDSQGIKSGTKLPPQIHKRLAEFAQDNLLSEEQIELRGKVVAGHIRWIVPKSLSPQLAQRLRNYMLAE